GATVAYDMASRYPDRFAGIADVSGGCPRHPTPLENLRTLGVYLMHGDKDSVVPIELARANAARLAELKVDHVLDIIKDGEHAWPENPADGERVRSWLRARKRDPWPRELDLIFASSR